MFPTRRDLLLLLAAQGSPAGSIDLHLDAAARVYITGDDGQPHLAPGAVTYSRRGETHSIIDRTATVPLPPGKYTVRAEKGHEFRAVERMVEVQAGESTRLDLEIPRFADMNKHGWYCGDLHIHRRLEEMPLLARVEELNVAPTITWHVGGGRPVAASFPNMNVVPVDPRHFVSRQNQEVERLRAGHGAVLLLNLREPIDPRMTDLFPMDLDFCRQARRLGAFIDAEKPIWKNVPLNAAFGLIDSIGVVNNHFHPRAVLLDAEKYGSMERDKPDYHTVAGFAQWMIDLYYSFLNCGFRVPVSAGAASGVMPSWPGYERVYVHLSDQFTYQQWFKDLKAGRSVATNGPLLRVYLNGKPPGAEIAWRKYMRVLLKIEADSQAGLDRIEVVFNGDVIHRTSSPATLTLAISEPGWLAVRCFEPVTETIRYAHSSPFYFPKDGKLPVKVSAALRWAGYIQELAKTVDPGGYPTLDDYEKAQATFAEAEAIYRRLASSA